MTQVIAGIKESRKGNTFGTTAFTSYGLFWLSLVFILVSGQLGWFETSRGFLTWYLFFWGLFTFAMMFATLNTNFALFFVFLSLTILFWLLAVAEVLSENLGRAILPIGQFGKNKA